MQVNRQRAAIVDAGAVGPLVDLLESDSDATVEAATAVLGCAQASSFFDCSQATSQHTRRVGWLPTVKLPWTR